MKLNKLGKLALAAAALFTLSAQAADLITFDPTGTGSNNISNVATFDWAPGSALANNVNTAAGIVQGTNFTTYYQANLGVIQNGNGDNVFSNGNSVGGSNRYFTAVAGFGETVTSCTDPGGTGACTNATFGFDNTLPNFFNIMAVGASGNNLTGTGFIGTSILTGHVVATGFGSSFNLTGVSAGALDQSANGNQWAGVNTVGGVGSSDIQIIVDSVDASYFPDIAVGTAVSFSFFNTTQNLPFRQVDPSKCLTDGVTNCAIFSDVGTYNGAPTGLGGGDDVLFQADGNQSFTRAAVPEPGALALAGLALVGAVVAGRRRRTAA